jgi:GNAT superfamily N-acetyltransferase
MTSAPEVLVRRATSDDRERVLDTVVAAFATDPAWAFITGGDVARVAPHFAAALFDARVAHGTVWVTDDCRGVAMWADRTGEPAEDELAARVWSDYRATVGEEAWAGLQRYDDALETYAPPRPYWYLGVLATHPSAQGTGLATSVLQPVFDVADAAGLDCWLETSVPANTAFYERRGFTERVQVDAEGLPTTWWMRRPPRR